MRGSRAVVIKAQRIAPITARAHVTNADSTGDVCHLHPGPASISPRGDDLVASPAIGMVDASYEETRRVRDRRRHDSRDGVVVGDVDRDAVEPIAGWWLDPVPGGVGPMTIAMLLRNSPGGSSGARACPGSESDALDAYPLERVRGAGAGAMAWLPAAMTAAPAGSVALNGADLLYYTQFQTAVLSLAGELFVDAAVEASPDPQHAWLDRIGLLPRSVRSRSPRDDVR